MGRLRTSSLLTTMEYRLHICLHLHTCRTCHVGQLLRSRWVCLVVLMGNIAVAVTRKQSFRPDQRKKMGFRPDHRTKKMSRGRKSLASVVSVWTEANLMHWSLVGICVLARNVLYDWSRKSFLVRCVVAALSVQFKSMFEAKLAAHLILTKCGYRTLTTDDHRWCFGLWPLHLQLALLANLPSELVLKIDHQLWISK